MKQLLAILLVTLGLVAVSTIHFGATITTATLATTTSYQYYAYCTSTSTPFFFKVSTTSYNNYRNNGTLFIVPASNCTAAAAIPMYDTPSGKLDAGFYTEYPLGTFHIPMFFSTTTATGTLTVIAGEVTTTTPPTAQTLQQYNN